MFILILDLHGSGLDGGKREELEAEEELAGDAFNPAPGGLETDELESYGGSLQRVLRLNIHHNLVFLETVTSDLSGGMFQLIA